MSITTADNPSLLFIWTDQQAAATMSAYGNERIETPNLDALAAESTVFANPYVTQSVCTPSRSAVLTGQYPHTTGLTENNQRLPPDATCFPELAEFEEYETAFMGKWHLGDEIFAQHGFEEWVALEDQYHHHYAEDRPEDAHSEYHEYLLEQGYEPDTEDDGFEYFSRGWVAANVPEEHSKPAFLAREASRFIREHQDEPFILHVMFLEPHQPYTSPRDDQYDREEIPLPENLEHDGFADQPLDVRFARESLRRGVDFRAGHVLGEDPGPEEWRELVARYWGLVSLVDTHVGRILDTLSDCGLAEETITVYTSDHGEMVGSHGLYSKMVQFEEAIKVPLLMRLPGVERNGDRIDAPVGQVDLVPTLLEAMGRPRPDHLEGYSWMPFLRGEDDLPEENVFVEWNGPHSIGFHGRHNDYLENPTPRPHSDPEHKQVWDALLEREGREPLPEPELRRLMTDPIRTVITPDGWKLNYRRSGRHELYDLDSDPAETENLAGDPDHRDTVERLSELIFAWQKRTGDPVYV